MAQVLISSPALADHEHMFDVIAAEDPATGRAA
jgi:hypothetical protein